MYFNQVTFAGKAKFVNTKHTASGMAVVSFQVSAPKKVKDEWVWTGVDVVCFGKTAEYAADNVFDDEYVLVTGELKEDRWEKDGVKHRKISILAQSVKPYAKTEGGTTRPRTESQESEHESPEPVSSGDDGVPW